MPPRIYLDHAATTPIRPEAAAAMAEGFSRWANPSSPHAEGRAARAALEDARARIKAALGWTGELILTSGASEAVALAFAGRQHTGAIVSAVEHDAVDFRGVLNDAQQVPVTSAGIVDERALGTMHRDGALVALQSANSETGVLQPMGRLAPLWRHGVLLTDCSQSAGKLPLPDADLIVVSAHKLGGPIGIGALLVRDLVLLDPTGGQERGYRRGTENLPAALGFAAALEASRAWFDAMPPLRAKLDRAIEAAGGEVIARDAPRISTIASYRMPGVTAAAQLIRLDMAGFAVSAGSACSSGTMRPSHVLEAMRCPHPDEVIRVSFGWTTTEAEVDAFAAAWTRIAADARARAA